MSVPLRILFVEDGNADAAACEDVLHRAGVDFQVRLAGSRDALLAALMEFRPDVVLAGDRSGQLNGLEALRLVRETGPDIPFIALTGAGQEDRGLEFLRRGADELLLEDQLIRLPLALARAQETVRHKQALGRAERALEASNERFRDIVETSADWIWETDARGQFTYVSPVSFSLLGYAPEELIGSTLFDLMAPAESEQTRALLSAAITERRAFSLLQYSALRKDGGRVVLETSGTPFCGADGVLLGYRGIDRDITERQRHEAIRTLQARRTAALLELPRAAERMDELEFMQFGLGLAEQLTDSRIGFIHFVNEDQETIELFTWSRGTLDGGYCQAIADRHFPISHAGVWAEALRRQAPVVYNDYPAALDRRGLPEGHAALARLVSVPVIDGRLVRMMAGIGNKPSAYAEGDVETLQLIANAIWRVVRQRRLDIALRESEERFRALFEQMQSGVCIYRVVDEGADFVLRDANLSVERIEKIPISDLRGRRVSEIFPGVVDNGLLAAFQRVWRTRLPEHLPPLWYSDSRRSGWRENFIYRLPHDELVCVYEDVTQRRELELALKETGERLALALDGSDLGMWDWQVQTGLIQCNARWAEMLGYTLDELEPLDIGTWIALCHPDDLVLAQERLEQHFNHATPHYVAETRLLHKDGHWVWVMDRGKVVERDADDRPVRVTGTHLDITARKIAEEALLKLSLAVEQSPSSIVITDDQARIEYANPAFTRVSGYSLEEALGQNPRILNSGHTPREIYDDLWATLARGEVWRGEFRNRRKDGGEYDELAIISPVREPNGRVTHYLAVKEDITERKRAEAELDHYRHHLEELVETRTAALKAAEERSRLILESSADGIYGEDPQGRVTFINPAACAMLGLAAEQVVGRSMHGLVHHRHPDGSLLALDECPVHGPAAGARVLYQEPLVFWRADGSALPVSYSAHPMSRDGEVVGSVISFFDTSAQKRADAAREAALAEAERLARLKSEFLANMSHEIRTPLNAVLGFAQVGARESDRRKVQDFFKRILDSGQLLLGIVNDILDYSKIEAGKLRIEQGVVDLRQLVRRAEDQIRTRVDEKGLEFESSCAADLPATCRGDGLRLGQILGNLLSNAVKFTERGQLRLEVSRDGEQLLFAVADTGIGMDETQVGNLFRPFEQADGSITRRFGGTGLGLAITKRLIDLMDGGIQIQSRIGVGSRFEVRLPLREPRGAICERSDAITPLPSAPFRERLKGLIILLAEDNAANRLVLEEMLNPEGCWLVQVGNGQEAVEHVRRDGAVAFDLVLMDIQMPIMDGYEATRRIRALAPDLAVVGLTAHALPAERERCLGAGMVDHVAKPVDLDTLVAVILRHARRPPRSSASEQAPEIWGAASDRRPSDARDVGENQAALDWSALEQRYRESPGFLPRLLQAVLESSQGLAEQLRQAAAGGDASQLGFVAHRVRGMAGNLFADDLVDRAARTEQSAGNEDPDGAAQQGLALADALDRMLAEIRSSRWFRDAQAAAADGPEPAPIDLERLSKAVEHLLSLLAIDDTKSAAHFDCHEDLLRQAFGEQAQALGLAIKRFDFQSALLILSDAWRKYQPD